MENAYVVWIKPPNYTEVRSGPAFRRRSLPGDKGDGYGDLLKYLPYDSYALYLGGSTITGLIAKLYV